MKPFFVIVILAVAVILGWIIITRNPSNPARLVNTITYACDNNLSIVAAYYESNKTPEVQPGQMPIPTGSVEVSLGGAATTTLHQTISADGTRYANNDESLIFWSKGNQVLIMRNNSMDLTYRNCTAK